MQHISGTSKQWLIRIQSGIMISITIILLQSALLAGASINGMFKEGLPSRALVKTVPVLAVTVGTIISLNKSKEKRALTSAAVGLGTFLFLAIVHGMIGGKAEGIPVSFSLCIIPPFVFCWINKKTHGSRDKTWRKW